MSNNYYLITTVASVDNSDAGYLPYDVRIITQRLALRCLFWKYSRI